MPTLKEPRPGMGQDEKDQLGQAIHEQANREAALEAAFRSRDRWLPDERLDDDAIPSEALRAEAELLGVAAPKSIARGELVRRIRARRTEAEHHQQARLARQAVPPTGAQ
jgi:hypothetical protein